MDQVKNERERVFHNEEGKPAESIREQLKETKHLLFGSIEKLDQLQTATHKVCISDIELNLAEKAPKPDAGEESLREYAEDLQDLAGIIFDGLRFSEERV